MRRHPVTTLTPGFRLGEVRGGVPTGPEQGSERHVRPGFLGPGMVPERNELVGQPVRHASPVLLQAVDLAGEPLDLFLAGSESLKQRPFLLAGYRPTLFQFSDGGHDVASLLFKPSRAFYSGGYAASQSMTGEPGLVAYRAIASISASIACCL